MTIQIVASADGLLEVEYVIAVHDEILAEYPGLKGFGQNGRGKLESALGRIENHANYAGLDDIFGIAALYAVAIAKGHAFLDANKRTALVCALAYLALQGQKLERSDQLDADLVEVMVDVAEGKMGQEDLADYLAAIYV